METLDIKEMFHNRILSPKLQTQGLYKLLEMIKYKCDWYGKTFIQISQCFPSSKKCSHCGHIYQELTLQETQWTCPNCKTKHDRDINASKNIENEGLRISRENTLNLWNREDSTVILLSLESTRP